MDLMIGSSERRELLLTTNDTSLIFVMIECCMDTVALAGVALE